MNNPYLEVISLVERLHRQFMEVMKLELEGSGVHDINNVQAMMLFNIGDAEMTVGELTLCGCYLGSNVSYNVKSLIFEVNSQRRCEELSPLLTLTYTAESERTRPRKRWASSCRNCFSSAPTR